MKVVAVMPAFQEASRIREALLGVQKHIPTVLVVDDGSSDGTAQTAKQAGAIVLRHAINRGQGAALKTGTIGALLLGADAIVHVDADGQHDPTFLPALLAPLFAGDADVVFGSRFLGVPSQGMPWMRRVVLGAARWFSTHTLGIPRRLTDPQSGLRALTASAARDTDFRQAGMAHCSEILRLVTRSGLRFQEVPIRVRYSSETLAKGNRTADAFKIVWHLFLGMFQ